MKYNYLVLLTCFFLFFQETFSQPPGDKSERLEAIKIGFITKSLDLSPAESQKFWPIYNQYQAELKKIRKDQRQDRSDAIEDFDKLDDKEAAAVIENMLGYEQAKVDLMRRYNAEFQKAVSARKVAKLYYTERQFKELIMKEIQERHHGTGTGPGGNGGPPGNRRGPGSRF